MLTKGKKVSISTTTNLNFNPNTHNYKLLIVFTTSIITPSIFFILLATWNITIQDFETIMSATQEELSSILCTLDIAPDATEALRFAWLTLNKGFSSDNDIYNSFTNIVDILLNPSVKSYHTKIYKSKHKLFTDNIKKIHTTDPNTLKRLKNALGIMRRVWDTVSRFIQFLASNNRNIIQHCDRPHRKKIQVNKKSQTKAEILDNSITFRNTLDYLDEVTDDEEIINRGINSMFQSESEIDFYYEVYKPYIAERAAEATN